MALTRGEAQEIYDAVTDALDGWIAGSERRRAGGSINDAALPDIKRDIAKALNDVFKSKGIQAVVD